MTTIEAFRAVTFDPTRVDVSDVTTQPYDRVSDAMKGQYATRSPYNMAQVILPEGERRAAREKVDAWLAQGVMREDVSPAIYVYEQRFRGTGETWISRRGVFVMVGVRPWSDGAVLPHEITFDPPRQDRLRFRIATQMNAEPVFLMYDDPARSTSALAEAMCVGEPYLLATDEAGEEHRVWRTDDPAQVAAITAALSGHQLYVADGHHRYEAALSHAEQLRGAGEATGGPLGAEGCLAVLFNIADGGLDIWPTHRVVRGGPGFDPAAFISGLEARFDVSSHSIDDLSRAKEEISGAGPSFLVATAAQPDRLLVCSLADRASLPETPSGSDAWRALDVNVLQNIVFPILGITPEELLRKEKVDFVRGDDEALALLRAGTHSVAFLMRPVPLAAVCEIARGGERMPQKSTDFYPKLLSGLVLHRLEMP